MLKRIYSRGGSFLFFVAAFMLLALSAHAEFTLTFNADPGAVNYSGSSGPVPNSYQVCGGGFCDESTSGGLKYTYPAAAGSFFSEVVLEAATGLYYWHTVLDQSSTNGFIQETYIKAAAPVPPATLPTECSIGGIKYMPCSQSGTGPVTVRNDGYFLVDYFRCSTTSGCNPSVVPGLAGSTDGSLIPNFGYYWNPISPLDNFPSITSNGKGNPNAVQIRQRLTGNAGAWTQEFNKSLFAKKPRITQAYSDTALLSTFDLDMSALDYSTNSTPGTLAYTLTLDPGVSTVPGPGDFNYAVDKGLSTLNAGRYIYTNGAGYGGAGGTYTYVDRSFNPDNIIWKQVYDPLQNPLGSWTSYYKNVASSGSLTAYWLVNGHWTAGQAYPVNANANCNAGNVSCPASEGWK